MHITLQKAFVLIAHGFTAPVRECKESIEEPNATNIRAVRVRTKKANA